MKFDRKDIFRCWAHVSAFLEEQFALQKSNLFYWVPVFTAFGIGTYFSLHSEPPLLLGVSVWMTSLGLIVFAFPVRDGNFFGQFIFLFSCVMALMSSGFLASQARTMRVDGPVLERPLGPVALRGRFEAIEHLEGKQGSRLILSNLEIERLSTDKTPHLIRLQLRADDGIGVGQRIEVLARLNPPSSALVPGGFDFRRYLFFKRIGAVGFVYRAPEIIETGKTPLLSVEGLRQKIGENIFSALQERQAGFVTALITGHRKGIAEHDQQAMRDAGLAHMLAISGLHVGIVAGFLFFFLRLALASIPALALHYPIKKISAVIAMLGAVFYMMLAGATVPTQRAVLMSGIVFLAIILDRSAISLRLVAFAALVILLIAPESLMSASFQLSFAAVAGLVAFYDATRSFWADFNRKAGFFRKAALYFLAIGVTTVIASLATAPFSLFHFQHVSVLGSVSNFVAVPLMAFWIMPMAVLSVILMPLGQEGFPLYLMGLGVQQVLEVAHWCAGLPWAIYHLPQVSFAAFAVFSFACVFFIIWRGIGKILVLPLLMLSFALAQGGRLPDILVSADHDIFAFKVAEDTLYVSSVRKEKFVRKSWERLLGYEEDTALVLPREISDGGIDDRPVCDDEGCRLIIKGRKISYSRSPYAQKSACAWADILIAENPLEVRPCSARIVIDKFDTWRAGAHALWLDDKNVRALSVQDVQGRRPWTPDWPEKR